MTSLAHQYQPDYSREVEEYVEYKQCAVNGIYYSVDRMYYDSNGEKYFLKSLIDDYVRGLASDNQEALDLKEILIKENA